MSTMNRTRTCSSLQPPQKSDDILMTSDTKRRKPPHESRDFRVSEGGLQPLTHSARDPSGWHSWQPELTRFAWSTLAAEYSMPLCVNGFFLLCCGRVGLARWC